MDHMLRDVRDSFAADWDNLLHQKELSRPSETCGQQRTISGLSYCRKELAKCRSSLCPPYDFNRHQTMLKLIQKHNQIEIDKISFPDLERDLLQKSHMFTLHHTSALDD